MRSRTPESAFAGISLVLGAVYAIGETGFSWRYGLLSPYYLVDFVAFALLIAGGVVALRARPRSAPGVATAGWAWTGANFWRATLARVEAQKAGTALSIGSSEVPAAIAMTGVAMIGMGVGLWLLLRRGDDR